MRFLSAVLLAVLALATVSARRLTSEQYAQKFDQFLQEHGKSYEATERAQRLDIFSSNYDFIIHHNEQASAGMHSFYLGFNQYADLTNAEYRKTLGYRHSGKESKASGTFTAKKGQQIPASVDWRPKGVVTPVKNQQQCGSCWAFSAVGAMEGAHALATGNLQSLSEQELVDCVNGGADNCQAGGEMHDGYLYAIQAGGMDSEASYPYTATSGSACAFNKTNVVATFSSYQNVTSGDEQALAAAVAARPTISVGIDASSMWFQLYSSGVYDDSSCQNTLAALDHGVLVVGYGHDATSGKDYWLVKNSWGATWGQAGYIWMVRNKNDACGIALDATFPLV